MLLDDIVFNKRQEIAKLKTRFDGKNPADLVKDLPRPRDFSLAFSKSKFSLIAEIKRASPSAGLIKAALNPTTLAKTYEESGAAAVSVLTDEKYFQGKLDDIRAAKESTTIPILRKDFILDERQVYESRIAGADAILLIVRLLADSELDKLLNLAEGLGLGALVEVHNVDEARRALRSGAHMIGLNNRDLDDQSVDLRRTLFILKQVPELKDRIVISESGIKKRQEIELLKNAGVDGVLVGEAILRSANITEKICEFL